MTCDIIIKMAATNTLLENLKFLTQRMIQAKGFIQFHEKVYYIYCTLITRVTYCFTCSYH